MELKSHNAPECSPLRALLIQRGVIVPAMKRTACEIDAPTMRLDDAGRRAAARTIAKGATMSAYELALANTSYLRDDE